MKKLLVFSFAAWAMLALPNRLEGQRKALFTEGQASVSSGMPAMSSQTQTAEVYAQRFAISLVAGLATAGAVSVVSTELPSLAAAYTIGSSAGTWAAARKTGGGSPLRIGVGAAIGALPFVMATYLDGQRDGGAGANMMVVLGAFAVPTISVAASMMGSRGQPDETRDD